MGSFDIPPPNSVFFCCKKQFVLFWCVFGRSFSLACFGALFLVFLNPVFSFFVVFTTSDNVLHFRLVWRLFWAIFGFCRLFSAFWLQSPVRLLALRNLPFSFNLSRNQSFLDVPVLAPPNHAVKGIILHSLPQTVVIFQRLCVFHFVFSEI